MDRGNVLITGCSGSLGAGLVRACLAAGYRVFATVSDLSRPGEMAGFMAVPALTLLPLDVCDASAVAGVVDHVEGCGRLDALIVNAGVYSGGVVETVDIADAEHVFDVNFFGALRCVQAVAPVMRRQRSGKIIGVSSLSAQVGLPCDGLYAASKAALEKLFESLRAELAPFGVKVGVVVPSSFPSKLQAQAAQKPFEKSSPYFPLFRAQKEESGSASTVEAVVAVMMDMIKRPGTEFRVATDERATSVLNKIYRWSEAERESAVLEWSGIASSL